MVDNPCRSLIVHGSDDFGVGHFLCWGPRRGKRYDPVKRAEELDAQGLLLDQGFKATRSFQVEEFEDEGSHYFQELENGNVLFLADSTFTITNLNRRVTRLSDRETFPNTEFMIRRHKIKKYVVHLACTGAPLEPEVVAPIFNPDDFGTAQIPEDGQIITQHDFRPIEKRANEK